MIASRAAEIGAQQAAVRALRREIGIVDGTSRRKYISDFTRQFTVYGERASYDDLLVQGFQSDLIYIGDYHALPSSQEFCARLLGDLIRRSDHVVLAVEMIFSRQQRILDEWWAGAMGDEEFLRRVRYEEEWGYPWSGYREVLDTARRHRVPILALDCPPRAGFRHIRRRDAHAAQRLADLLLRRPQAKVVILMGESHLARNHLPLKVERELFRRQMDKRPMVVVQNIDALYWQRATRGEDDAEVVRLDRDRYCVFNASPMRKYEAYRRLINDWRALSTDEEVDLAPTVYSMIETILRFLRLDRFRTVVGRRDGTPVRLVDVFPEVYASQDATFIRSMMSRYGLGEEHSEQVLGHLERAGSSFVPRLNAIFVGTFNLVHAGEESSHFLNFALRGELYESWDGSDLLGHDRFYSAVMDEAVGYFGSKIIDPSRNHFFETDFYRYYGKNPEEVEKSTGYSYAEFSAIIDFILLHKKFERRYDSVPDVPPELLEGISSQGRRFSTLTHELGYFLGQQIYDGLRQGLVRRRDIVALYRQGWREPSSALKAYLEWVERLVPLAGG